MPFHILSFEGPDSYSRARGIACTGGTGEEYALPSYNALVLEAGTADEFAASFERLRRSPREAVAMRRAARSTALRCAWPRIVERVLLPRLEAFPERPLGILP